MNTSVAPLLDREGNSPETTRSGCVLVKSSGAGLGDSLRAVILALLYAGRTDRRVIIDWRDGRFGEEGENTFPHFFELLDGLPSSRPEDWYGCPSVTPEIWRGNLHKTMVQMWGELRIAVWDREVARQKLSFNRQHLASETVCVMWDFDEIADYNLSQIQTCTKRYLRPTQAIREQCTDFCQQHFKPSMLGVHIRAAKEEAVQKMLASPETIRKKVDRILDIHGCSGIFLATDHAPTQDWFLRVYPDTVIRHKPFSPDESPLHLTDFGQPRSEQTRDALLDMLLLSSCQALLYPISSSFSICASYLSPLPQNSLYTLAPSQPVAQRLRKKILSMYQKSRGLPRST